MINILMIEDDNELASILTNYLSQYNIKVTNYETPELGISALNLKRYDLIILDLSLPNIDGIEVCKMIRHRHDRLYLHKGTKYATVLKYSLT